MPKTKAGSRLRVMVTDLALLKRGLVAHSLEGGGLDILPSTPSPKELVRVVGIEQPDAVVLDGEMLAAMGSDAIQALKSVSPSTKVLVITPAGAGAAETGQGADRYVDAGADLASMPGVIVDLCGEPTVVIPDAETGEETVIVPEAEATGEAGAAGISAVETGAEGAESTTLPTPIAIPEAEGEARKRDGRLLLSRVMLVAGIAIIAISLFAAVRGNRTHTVTTAAESPAAGGGISPPAGLSPAAPQTQMSAAYATLDDLVAALKAGRYVEAQVDAQLLMDQRAAAQQAGFALSQLDADITKALEPLVADMPARVYDTLAAILGNLMPPLPAPAPAGGGAVILAAGPTTGGGGSTTTGGGSTGGGGGSTGGGTTTDTFPGKGSHSGWENKPPKGGWHGKPPGR